VVTIHPTSETGVVWWRRAVLLHITSHRWGRETHPSRKRYKLIKDGKNHFVDEEKETGCDTR
jgi:hypothetical protein